MLEKLYAEAEVPAPHRAFVLKKIVALVADKYSQVGTGGEEWRNEVACDEETEFVFQIDWNVDIVALESFVADIGTGVFEHHLARAVCVEK